MTKSSQKGFTMIEVMTVVALVAIVSSFAFPAMRNMMVQSSLTSTANNVVAALQMARSQAVRENAIFTIVPMATGWNGGWCVIRGDVNDCSEAALPADVIRQFDPIPVDNIEIVGPGKVTAFRTGVLDISGVVKLTAVSGNGSRIVTFNRGGSVTVVRND